MVVFGSFSVDEIIWVNGCVDNPNFVMQMRSGAVACAADKTN
jgi:hypothetical protein